MGDMGSHILGAETRRFTVEFGRNGLAHRSQGVDLPLVSP